MRVKFRDVECFRDYQYEYEDSLPKNEFTVWKPPSLEEIKEREEKEKEQEKVDPVKNPSLDPDIYTEMFAEELNLRSLKNQSADSDMENLDLSFLDYDVVDVLEKDMNSTLNFTEIKSKPETSTINPDTLTEMWFLILKVLNITIGNLQNQSTNENTTHILNSSTPLTQSVLDSSNLYQTENQTGLNSHNVSQKDSSTTRNGSLSSETTRPNVVLQEPTNPTAAPSGNSSNSLERERINVTLTTDNHTSIEEVVQDSEEKNTRGDVFSYSVPLSKPSINNFNSSLNSNLSADTLLENTKREDETNTAVKFGNTSAERTNHSLSVLEVDVEEVSSNIKRNNLTILELTKSTENKTSDNNTFLSSGELEYGLQINLEVVTTPTNSSYKNVTQLLLENEQNVTGDASSSALSVMSSMGREENISSLFDKLTNTSLESLSNQTTVSGNQSLSSEELGFSESSEEVIIFLKENNTEAIKTSLVKIQGHNWTYEGTYQMIPEELPDQLKKHFEKETPQTTLPPKKKVRVVNRRQRPEKGHGMKTRKRKEYKPQARSGLPFSPRGFNPGMTPRGSRPHSPKPVLTEDHVIDMPVVIGVPRPDFSDYELYIPGGEPDHLALEEQDFKADEYEYVMYKDPYSVADDIRNLDLDETTKYYLRMSGPDVKTYFIAAEEVEWDYAGYGQK